MASKPVYALVNNIFFATKIVKTTQALGLEARAFDASERLCEASRAKEPCLVLMDCEGLEKEAFRVLEEFRSDEKLSRVPRVGYLSHTAQDLRREVLSAGATQVYSRSEFSKGLENLLMRYTYGFPSRF